MTSIEGHATFKHSKPGPHILRNSAPVSVVDLNFVLYCAADHWLPIETTWAEVWLGACLLLTMHVCERKKTQLPLGSHYDLSMSKSPLPWFFQTYARLHASGTVLEAS